ncbi:hypothetical protein NQZ79_g7703 [Umbelopsis isabellina]|nr:hypothetical protein NQZ79_g7703 [Umbelopsis isabellina]
MSRSKNGCGLKNVAGTVSWQSSPTFSNAMTSNQQEPDITILSRGRYVSVEGPFIETCAQEPCQDVSSDMRCNRVKRDGLNHHHLTFINPFELKKAGERLQAKKKVASRIIDHINAHYGAADTWDPPMDLGVGRIISKDDAVTIFKVIHWPAGQEIRRSFGLNPAFLHVTIGFAPTDVHEYKGPGSLDTLNGRAPCPDAAISLLIYLVPYYSRDVIFLRKLAIQCWKKGYYRYLIYLFFKYLIGESYIL